MLQPLAVTIIGGYLGAGKTTLVNQLLRHANGKRLAVLVNEFGALPIDEDLIEARDEDLISIAGGCVCCSFGSDLTAALMTLSERLPIPDHIIIESSGVAMPGAIAANIGLMQQYLLAGVVVLADSETIITHATDEFIGDTIVRQLKDADLIVQTKSDLVSGDYRKVVNQWFSDNYPGSQVLPAEQGNVPGDVILGLFATRDEISLSRHGDDLYDSAVFDLPHSCDAYQLGKALAADSIGLVRAKGFVIDGDGQIQLLQVVGRRFTVTRYSASARAQIACIGLRNRINQVELVDIITQLCSR